MKNKSFFRVAIAILTIIVTSLSIGFQKAWADGDIGTSMFVSPMIQELLLTPGEQYQGTILVSSSSEATKDLEYTVEVGSYGWNSSEDSKDDYGAVDVDTKSQYNMIMDWIKLDREGGTLKPGMQDKILFTINVPESAPAGAQYASILVANATKAVNENESKDDGIQIKSIPRMASAIVANVAGTTVEKGIITENSMPTFLLNNNLEATSMVKNEGNAYTNAEYVLQVWPMFSDEEICTNEEEPAKSMVLPETSKYHMETCQLPSVGIFRAKQTVRIFGEESIVEKTIIVCPVWLLFIIFFVIAALIIWLVMRTKARGKSQKSRRTSTAAE